MYKHRSRERVYVDQEVLVGWMYRPEIVEVVYRARARSKVWDTQSVGYSMCAQHNPSIGDLLVTTSTAIFFASVTCLLALSTFPFASATFLLASSALPFASATFPFASSVLPFASASCLLASSTSRAAVTS